MGMKINDLKAFVSRHEKGTLEKYFKEPKKIPLYTGEKEIEEKLLYENVKSK